MLSEGGFVCFQNPEEPGCVCAHICVLGVAGCAVSAGVTLPFPEEEPLWQSPADGAAVPV